MFSHRNLHSRCRRAYDSWQPRIELLESRYVLAGTPIALDASTTFLTRYELSFDDESGGTPTELGGQSFEVGRVGRALRFDPTGFARYDATNVIDPNEGSIEFWIRPHWNGDDDNQTRLFFEIGDNFNNGILLSIDGANNLRFLHWGDNPATPEIETNVEAGVGASAAHWQADVWTHVAGTWSTDGDMREMSLYVDGQLVASTTTALQLSGFSTDTFVIGADINGNQPADASFDEFRLSNVERSAAEVSESHLLGTTLNLPNDPLFSQQSGLHNTGQSNGVFDADVDAPEAWNLATGSSAVIVAVLDTGVEYTHPELYENIWINPGEIPFTVIDTDSDGVITFRDLNHADNSTAAADVNGNGYIDAGDLLSLDGPDGAPGPDAPVWMDGIDDDNNGFIDDLTGWNFQQSDNNNDPFDDHGHGTHVAGIIGAAGNNGAGIAGINRRVSILPLKFLDSDNDGFTSDAIAATEYVNDMRSRGHNIRFLNNSWQSAEGFVDALYDELVDAGEVGILTFAGAGNGDFARRANNNDLLPVFPAGYELDNVLSVTATNDRDELVSFYNFGPTTVDLAAPGLGILSTDSLGGYRFDSGTSFATAFATGAAALLASAWPHDATWQEYRAAILASVDLQPSLETKTVTEGRINIERLLLADHYQPRAEVTGGGNDIVVAGNPFKEFAVTYRDNDLIRRDLISPTNLEVRKEGSPALLPVELHSIDRDWDDLTITATYRILAPGGDWNNDDNGTYSVTLGADLVQDQAGNPARIANPDPPTSDRLLTFEVDILEPGAFRVNTVADTIDANPGDGFALDAAGNTSLRAAVMESNALAGDNRIVLPAGTYQLDYVEGLADDLTGDLVVSGGSGSLSIEGIGYAVIDGSAMDRIFYVFGGAELSLDGIDITNGFQSSGGGIYVSGATLSLTDVTLDDNEAAVGGAIYATSSSTVDLVFTTIHSNSAGNAGGGMLVTGGSQIDASATFVYGNDANFGGGILVDGYSNMTFENSEISFNRAGTTGGGIYKAIGGYVAISETILWGNRADYGGAIGNMSSYNFPGELSNALDLKNVVFFDNIASRYGGAVFNRSRMQVVNSTFMRSNGAIYNATWDNNPNYVRALVGNSVFTANYGPAIEPGCCNNYVSMGYNSYLNGSFSTGTQLHPEDRFHSVPIVDVDPVFPYPYGEVDTGSDSLAPDYDLHGHARPQDADADGTATADRGALEIYFGSVSGSLFHDINESGLRDNYDRNGDGNPDTLEPVLSDWDVFSDLNGNGVYDLEEPLTRTDSAGEFFISFLEPGDHRIVAESRDLWTNTFPSPAPYYDVTVATGQTESDLVFARKGEAGKVEGIVFHDVNEDGIQQDTELAVNDWRIYVDLNRNQLLDIGEPVTTTDQSGRYVFDNLPPGVYPLVSVEEQYWYPTLPTPSVTVLQTSFTDGGPTAEGFVSNGPSDLWHLSTGRSSTGGHSSPDSFYFGQSETASGGGNYAGVNSGTLLSPMIDLTQVRGSAEVSFDHFLQVNSADEVMVRAIVDGESTTIASSNGDNVDVLRLDNTTNQFSNVVLDLTPFSGSEIQLAFDVVGNDQPQVAEKVFASLNNGSTYFVEVRSESGQTVDNYELFIEPVGGDVESQQLGSAPPAGQDGLERGGGNNTFGTATELSEGPDGFGRKSLTIHQPTDVDFFKFESSSARRYKIGVKYNNAPTQLEIRVYDQSQNLIASSAREGWYVDDILVRGLGSHVLDVNAGDEFDDVNFGVHSEVGAGGIGQNAVVSGSVFHDTNQNGRRDSGEGPIVGATLWLDIDQDGFISAPETTTTQTDGTYEFRRLPPGVFEVKLLEQPESRQTFPLTNQFEEFERPSGSNPQAIHLAHFNSDDFLDSVVTNSSDGTIAVFLGTQGETIPTSSESYDVQPGENAPFPTSVVSGDIDGDSDLDLIVGNLNAGTVSVFVNDGTGNFNDSPTVLTGLGPLTTSVAVARIDDNDSLDIVVTAAESTVDANGHLVLLLNDGAGGFPANLRQTLEVSVSPESLVIAQFNDDNNDQLIDEQDHPDIAVANYGNGVDPGTVSIVMNNRDQAFAPQGALALVSEEIAGRGAFDIAAGNLDDVPGDDLVVANPISSNVSIHLNDGVSFSAANYVSTRLPTSVVVVDVDGDGDNDVVSTNARSRAGAPSVTIARNDGTGAVTIANGATFAIGVLQGSPNYSVQSADLNNDGIADLAIAKGDAGNAKYFVNTILPGDYQLPVETDATVANVDFGLRLTNTAEVVNRSLFYNDSVFDGFEPAANANDDLAIALNKTALLPGQTATFANYSSVVGGITGIMIDIQNLPADVTLGAADFEFSSGNDNMPDLWSNEAAPSDIQVRYGAGSGGSDRITLTWPSGVIVGKWLEVTVLASDKTGLLSNDVFYFGNAPGETGDTTTDAIVNGSDFLATRASEATFLNPADVESPFDHNRDGRINATDLLIVRDHATIVGTSLSLISPPLSAPAKGSASTKESATTPPHELTQSTKSEVGPIRKIRDLNTTTLDDGLAEDQASAIDQVMASMSMNPSSLKYESESTLDEVADEKVELHDFFSQTESEIDSA